MKAIRRGVAKRRATLEKSMAHIKNPRPCDVTRWSIWRADIAKLEVVLAELAAGGNPPASPRTGEKTRELPDAVS